MYLGVEMSLSNRRWLGPALAIERDALALHQHSDLPLPLCYVLARLGVAPTEVADFLNPTLRVSMSDPLSLSQRLRQSRSDPAHSHSKSTKNCNFCRL